MRLGYDFARAGIARLSALLFFAPGHRFHLPTASCQSCDSARSALLPMRSS